MLKKALSVCAVAVFSAALYAAGPEVRSDHPESYVVKKGDTLWGISGRFLKNPWYWPEIWQANPQIANPHLIYPGDVVSLVYIDGKPRLLVNGEPPADGPDLAPRIRDEGSTDAVPPLPLAAVREFLSRPRVLTEEEYKAAPYLVAGEEDRLRVHDANLAYVRQLDDGRPGQRWVVARPTLVYRDMPVRWSWGGKERQTVASSWNLSDQWHWSLREWFATRGSRVLGHELLEIGTATVSSGGDPATVYVTYSDMEMRAGDVLLPIEESPYELNFYPRPPKAIPENTRVLAFTEMVSAVGPMQVVVINKGAADGLEPGEVYSVYQEGDLVQDKVAYPEGSVREFFNPRKKKVKLPDEFVGHAMVFRCFDQICYGLVMNAVRPVRLGAWLRGPTEI